MFAECAHTLSAHYGLTASLFLAGLVGSATHCAGMCAPFVLAQTQGRPALGKPSGNLLIPYHLGRMTTYVAMGVAVQSLINLAFIFSDSKAIVTAPLLMLAGIVFLVTAFPALAGIFPWAAKIRLPGAFTVIAQKGHNLIRSHGTMARYLMGMTLGLIPCGLVIAALMAAATAPTALQAGLAMVAFSIGTMPALVMIGLFGHTVQRRFPVFSRHVPRFAMAVSSLWLFTLAGSLIF